MFPGGNLDSFGSENSASSVVWSHLELTLHSCTSLESECKQAAILIKGVDQRHNAENGEPSAQLRSFDSVE